MKLKHTSIGPRYRKREADYEFRSFSVLELVALAELGIHQLISRRSAGSEQLPTQEEANKAVEEYLKGKNA